MAAPTTTVEVVFDETPVYDGIGFTLDDTEKGVLNNPYYVLDGHLNFIDVSSLVQEVSVTRGRSRQLDQYQTGTATISFYNASRALDPLNTASAYYPYVIPRRYVRIKTNGIFIFAGLINSWSLTYDNYNMSYVNAQCSDAFAILANQTINAYTPSEELTGSRINNVLNLSEISFTATSASINTGSSTLGAFPVEDQTNALNYLQQIEKSEQGFLYASASNTLTFKDRTTVLAQTGAVAFTDDGTGTSGYQTLDVDTGDTLLYNRVVAQTVGGVAQIVSDATSIATYDTITLEATDLLNSTDTEVLTIANLLLQQYKSPEVRFTGLSQMLSALSDTNQNKLLSLDLTDLATVLRTYTTGSPASVTKYVIIEGITHSIKPMEHTITYSLGALQQAGFILDSGIFGLLDVGSLT